MISEEDKEYANDEVFEIMHGHELAMRKAYPRQFREARRAAKTKEQNGHIAQQTNG